MAALIVVGAVGALVLLVVLALAVWVVLDSLAAF